MEYEQLPEYLTYLDAVMPDAIRIHEDTPNIFCEQPVLKGAGLEDAEEVRDLIDKAPHVVEGSFSSSVSRIFPSRVVYFSLTGAMMAC